jgi:threonine dehydrogenase-like Zn-dependent dehydrogenase
MEGIRPDESARQYCSERGHVPRRARAIAGELAGRIVDGPGAGARVTVNPLITCGMCEWCLQGRDNLCAHRTMIGALRHATVSRATGAAVYDPAADESPAPASVDLVIDAVGAKATRTAALAAVKRGGVVLHIGLLDWESEIDMRKLTLAEIALIGTYTYATADVHAAVQALHEGAFGDLAWVEERPLADGGRAFGDLHDGRAGAAKILLRP